MPYMYRIINGRTYRYYKTEKNEKKKPSFWTIRNTLSDNVYSRKLNRKFQCHYLRNILLRSGLKSSKHHVPLSSREALPVALTGP